MKRNLQDQLKENLLDEPTAPPQTIDNEDILKPHTLDTTDQGPKESVIKEIYIDPTLWNNMKLFLANTYEVALIAFGLALSMYDDDISSFVFQIVMQVMLVLSMKSLGENTQIQRKISMFVMAAIAITAIIKWLVIEDLNPTLNDTYSNIKKHLSSFGFEVVQDAEGYYSFDVLQSVMFEIVSLIITGFLYQYYNSRMPKEGFVQQTGYIYHSMWLNQYMKLYYIFFLLITIDTCVVHNLTQFMVLCFMLLIMYLWAYRSEKKNAIIKFAVIWSQRLYILQFAMLALTQISYIIEPIKTIPWLYNSLFSLGLILDNSDVIKAGYHVMTICAILAFGQLYEATYQNYLLNKERRGDLSNPLGLAPLKVKLLSNKQKKDSIPDGPTPTTQDKKKTSVTKTSKGGIAYYIETYGAYIYIWIARFSAIVLAYYYHSSLGFVLLTWVLFSFIINISQFVNFTVLIINPLFTAAFLYLYVLNIPGLKLVVDYSNTGHPMFKNIFGVVFINPIFETAFMVFTLMFFLLLIPTRYILRLQRDEFRIALFRKLSDKNSNFLWQLLFYSLKRIHIIVLLFIFLFGLQELNIYMIGLLFFFVVFASSLNTYRKSGIWLIVYASFFIWIEYFWSVYQVRLNPTTYFFKFLQMLTFTTVVKAEGGINQFLEHNIPYWQWIVLFLYVIMGNVNRAYRRDKPKIEPDFDNNKKMVEYGSTAEFYEAKCDYVLRKKFPTTTKILNAIVFICSEMMILIILIVQGFILAFQPPSILFWGFLALSLTLQRIVVSAGDENPELYKRCARQSKILKIYAMFVIILQVSFHFISDKNFLAQYGFDEAFTDFIGPFSEYLDFIGLQNLAGQDVAVKFISQIAFYIMAVILEDYFIDQLRAKNLLSQAEIGYDSEGNQYDELAAGNYSEIGRKSTVRCRKEDESQVINIEDEQAFENDLKKYEYERVRYTIPFLVYRSMGLWRVFDEIAMNFHLITATVTLAFCLYFSISLFFSFYLICTVILCIRAATVLYRDGKSYPAVKNNIDINEAHRMNKSYTFKAARALLHVRSRQWNYQYWLLILSMIIMYPTPFFQRFKERKPEYTEGVNNTIFWMFWSGIYVSPEDLAHYGTYGPYYALVVVLIFEKYAQRWLKNRYACTFEKITYFKELEEELELISKKERPDKINRESPYPAVQRDFETEFVTIGEARQECNRIQSLYRKWTNECEETRLKEILVKGISRKYMTAFRNSMKIGMEQLSLFLLLLSAAYKSNLISILYMGILLSFLMIKNKTTGMLIMTIAFGVILALQYIAVLFNLTSLTTPYEFPPEFNPYPNLKSETPYGQYIIPLYLKSEFLRQNLIWTNFFGFDIERATLDKIWFDFVNLALMTIYFFWYGNPINSRNIKVSFSSTRSLEDALNNYAKLQIKRKAMIKKKNMKVGGNIEEEEEEKEEDREFEDSILEEAKDSYSDIAADNSNEYFLGATYYLTQLKQNNALYLITKRAKYMFFIGWQIVTLLSIFILAFLCTSIMSIGYMIACVPLILSVNDFFRQEKLQRANERWKHPQYICGPILIYSFIDIAIQIAMQVPVFAHGNKMAEWFGFDRIWIINPDAHYSDITTNQNSFFMLNESQLKFLILKCLNMFFIFLQNRIYESESFHKFMKRDLRKLMTIAKSYKRQSLTFRFNNWKLQKIVTTQKNLKTMYNGVAQLKYKIKIWQQLVQKGLEQSNLLSVKEETKETTNKTPLLSLQQEDSQTAPPLPSLEKNESEKKESKKKGVQFDSIISQESQQNEKIELEQQIQKQIKKEVLEAQKEKLPKLAKWYLGLHKTYINAILFQTEVEEASLVKKDMQVGKRKICSELEVRMMQDISLHHQNFDLPHIIKNHLTKKKKKNGKNQVEPKEFKLTDMPRTMEFLQPSTLFASYLYAVLQAVLSNLQFFAYFFMVLSQFYTAGFISIIYPFAVFGYAIMEESRPGKKFWQFMIKYTLFILFMKFLFQLDIWMSVDGLQSNYIAANNWIMTGLQREKSTWNLLVYIFPETMILLTVMGQQFIEMILGLGDRKEVDIEHIEQARQRLMGKKELGTTFMQQKRAKRELDDIGDDDLDEEGFTYADRSKEFKGDIQFIQQCQKEMIPKDNFSVREQADQVRVAKFKEEVVEKFLSERRHSLVDDMKVRMEIVRTIKEERQKNKSAFRKFLTSHPYFKSLFPEVKEQKPGIDLYAWITFVQFMICIYLISFYTEIDTEGTQNLESSSQFSFHMVMVLFIQVAVMIVERYVNRTNPRTVVKRIGSSLASQDELNDDKILLRIQQEDIPRSMSVHVDLQTMKDTIVASSVKRDAKKRLIHESPEIVLNTTKITSQQLVKFFMQWILLIIYHILIFWIYPINSNYVIYGTPDCNPESPAYKNYGCLSFHQNSALKFFYIIFCIYFTLSALQIRYGLPDFRKGSSLLQNPTMGNKIIWLIYYNLPFALELKTMLDWAFTKTSLDLFEWLQLAQFHSEMYNAKVSGQNTYNKKFGSKIKPLEKWICGCLCIGTVLFFLVGPFLMFSNLSFIASYNLVTDSSVELGMKIQDLGMKETYQFPLFSAQHPLSMQTLSEAEFMRRMYHEKPETKFFEYDQVQIIRLKNGSETEWSLSKDYRQKFEDLVEAANNKDKDISIEIDFTYSFMRPGPLAAQTTSGLTKRVLNQSDDEDMTIIQDFYKASQMFASGCNGNTDDTLDINLYDFVVTKLRLTEQSTVQPAPFPPVDIKLTYSCENFWSLNVDDRGIVFTTFSDLISGGFFSATSIMGFYMGVALIVGQTFRSSFIYKGDRVFIVDSKDTGSLLNLIECIYIARIEKNIKKEEELFHVLLELLRSPELLLHITGTSLREKL